MVAKQINARTPQKTLWASGTPLTLTLANNQTYPHPGTFFAADRQIEAKTGTIRISASFPNPDRLLRPGQYGRVHADTHIVRDALLIPQRAVTSLQGASQLRVVAPDNTIQVRTVTLGARVGSGWIAQGGVAAGDRVVMDSASLPQGTRVNVKPYIAEDTSAPSTTDRTGSQR